MKVTVSLDAALAAIIMANMAGGGPALLALTLGPAGAPWTAGDDILLSNVSERERGNDEEMF